MTYQSPTSASGLNALTNALTVDDRWKGLFKVGGFVAILMLIYSLATMLLLFIVGGQPASAQEGFTMLQANRLVGFLRLDGLTTLVMPGYFLLFLGLYQALKKTGPALAAVLALLGCAGLTLFLASPSVFSWLALADKFAAATDAAQKNLMLAAGEAVLATDMWHGSGATLGGILMQTGMMLASLAMLRSTAFGKLTAWLGVVMHGLDLLHILVGLLLPAGGVVLMMIAGPLYLLWFPLLARDFFRMGNEL